LVAYNPLAEAELREVSEALSNTIIYLVGPHGVGKYTIGAALADALPAKLVDNHHWLNPLFSLIHQDGRTPLPAGIWEHVAQVRKVVLETIATLSPQDWNFVFTHAVTGDAADEEYDREIAREVLDTAHRRGANLLVVRLGCAPDELATRVISPERRLRMKEVDPEAARRNAVRPLFNPNHRNTMTIDTTNLSALEVAAQIVQKLKDAPSGARS
jgi:predicted kinase